MSSIKERRRDLKLVFTDRGTRIELTKIDRIHPETKDAIWTAYTKYADDRNKADKDPDGIDGHTDDVGLDDLAGFLELDPVDSDDARDFLRLRTLYHVQTGGNPDSRTTRTIEEFITVMFGKPTLKAA